MRDYREKKIKGCFIDGRSILPMPCNVTVRMTSDDIGQTLSLNAYGVMISIPLESVRDIVMVSKKGE